MILLYTKIGDKACEAVKTVFEERRLSYEERSIDDPFFAKELASYHVEKVPFMIDPQANFSTQDSEDMIDYASECSF
jgi:hypothetical protein